MPSSLAARFTAQLREVQQMAGMGPTESPAAAMSGIRDTLGDVSAAAGRAWQQTQWVGDGGNGASEFTQAIVAAVDRLASQADHLGTTAARAADAVDRARARLRAIVDEFEARSAALEAHLDEPGVAEEIIAEGRRALDEATAVVDGLRTELDAQADAVIAQPTAPAAALPDLSGWGMPSSGGSAGSAMPGAGSTGAGIASGFTGSGAGSGSGPESMDATAAHASDPAEFGSGVSVQLPNGATVTAPNAVAASAVRHALTQLGVPYRWGGEAPGVGMDCSGLTQWAYHEAGLDLPRLAQEQDIGTAVGLGSLRPGDLAVWDGHVAMIVGDGTMIEAGSPVKLSPIRTTNAGQGFQGFWRPTE